MSSAPTYSEPFFWWGPVWAGAKWRSITELLREGTIETADAAFIWAALARRRSLAVIAGPSGSGKSTLLGALLDLLPEELQWVFVRGSHETFAFRSDVAVTPARTALIVNEISPHLPVYLWGPAVSRLLEIAAEGFALLATAHAESVAAFVALLAGPPLRVAPARVATFEYVVLIGDDDSTSAGRHVSGIWRLSAERDGVVIEPISASSGRVRSLFPAGELMLREQLLRRLLAGDITDARELRALAARYFVAPAVELA